MTLKIPATPSSLTYQANSSDDIVKLAIADRDAHVVIYFGCKRISWIEMPNYLAIEFAKMLLRRAGFRGTLEIE